MKWILTTYILHQRDIEMCKSLGPLPGACSVSRQPQISQSGKPQVSFQGASIFSLIKTAKEPKALQIHFRLILTSPRGTRSSLLLPRPKDKLATSFEDWPFLSVHYWGEDPTGQWTLQVAQISVFDSEFLTD